MCEGGEGGPPEELTDGVAHSAGDTGRPRTGGHSLSTQTLPLSRQAGQLALLLTPAVLLAVLQLGLQDLQLAGADVGVEPHGVLGPHSLDDPVQVVKALAGLDVPGVDPALQAQTGEVDVEPGRLPGQPGLAGLHHAQVRPVEPQGQRQGQNSGYQAAELTSQAESGGSLGRSGDLQGQILT